MNKNYKVSMKIDEKYSGFSTNSALKALTYYRNLAKHGFQKILILMKNGEGKIRKISESLLEKKAREESKCEL